MAIRPGITVDFLKSPRLITIAAPSVTETIQDIHDTLRDIERKPRNGSEDFLVASVGKGGAGTTGVALTLNDAQILFEPRTTKLETGTVTTPDTAGITLTDSAALFQTNGVGRGDIALNATDGSHSTVLSVTSETALVTLPLVGGVDNQWDSADSYEIFDYVSCSITAGDLFAVDDAGAPLAPILNTFGVGTLTIEQDTSPAAAPVQPTTVLDGSLTWEQSQRLILAAAAAGNVTGAPSGPIIIKDAATGLKTRITATVDGQGNRTVTIGDVT